VRQGSGVSNPGSFVGQLYNGQDLNDNADNFQGYGAGDGEIIVDDIDFEDDDESARESGKRIDE